MDGKRLLLLAIIIALFASCSEFNNKQTTFVLKDTELSCDFDTSQLVIDTTYGIDKNLKGKIVLPIFRDPSTKVADQKYADFYRKFKSDTGYYHKITVKGLFANSPYDENLTQGCKGAYYILVSEVV